jgi:hypothetical protein
MLRRLSVHAAGLIEASDVYICKDMNAPALRAAVDDRFTKYNAAFEQYAIAGVLHLDHLADMARDDQRSTVVRHAVLLAPAMNLSVDETEKRLSLLLSRHALEWRNYLKYLGPNSFVRKWTRTNQ